MPTCNPITITTATPPFPFLDIRAGGSKPLSTATWVSQGSVNSAQRWKPAGFLERGSNQATGGEDPADECVPTLDIRAGDPPPPPVGLLVKSDNNVVLGTYLCNAASPFLRWSCTIEGVPGSLPTTFSFTGGDTQSS